MAPSFQGNADPIDLTADSDSTASLDPEEEDLRQAIALSLQDQEETPAKMAVEETRIGRGQKTASVIGGLLSIDRRQMEQDRLARLKRKRNEVSPPPLARPSNFLRQELGSSLHQTSSTKEMSTTQKPRLTSSQPEGASKSTSDLKPPFSEGVVRKTWCLGFPRDGDDIKLEEILDRPNLEAAVLSSFIWDFDWLFPKFDTKRTKFVLVMHAKEAQQRRQIEEDFAGIPNMRLCFPSMDGIVNCMHSKLMLLFYSTYMRVVVPTANLVPFDWGEQGGVMENSIFVIDLPKRQNDIEKLETGFYRGLHDFTRAQGLQDDVLQRLDEFDFRKTAGIGFVHSIGGMHSGQAWKSTGLCGLGRTVASLGLQTTQKIQADFVTSSVGSLNDEFMRSIYLAAQGDDGLTEYTLRTSKRFPAQREGDRKRVIAKDQGSEWKERFRFYFPTATTVEASKGGPGMAGTICFSEKWWDSAKFPQSNMRDCISLRKGLLMHNKLLFVRFPTPVTGIDNTNYLGWAYVGSANLSESAWGRLVQDKVTKSPKLNCRNWECGVLIPVGPGRNELAGSADPILGDLDGFRGRIPIPMLYPGQHYGVRRPWFFDSQRSLA